jgi:hypothetical protein
LFPQGYFGRRLRANQLSGIARRGRSFYREDVPGGEFQIKKRVKECSPYLGYSFLALLEMVRSLVVRKRF